MRLPDVTFSALWVDLREKGGGAWVERRGKGGSELEVWYKVGTLVESHCM